MPLPWMQMIKLAPTILSLANDLRQRARRIEEQQQEPEIPALREIEEELRQQAELLHALARQMEGLTAVLATMRRSLLLAVVLGGAAMVLALAALLFALLR